MEKTAGLNELLQKYRAKRFKITQRLKDFRHIYKTSDRKIFQELSFCILTPQANALFCDEAVRELSSSNLLYNGTKDQIRSKLGRVRFPNNKAAFLVSAREGLKNGKALDIKRKIDHKDIFKTREWFAKNIKGLGYKEASHFLRNIGLGRDIAILDVHILRNLKKYRVIKEIPSSITKNKYFDIEKKMNNFSQSIGIPMEDLDLLFWSEQTGFIFK